ncbi:PIN domain protein [compost metagenome]
MQIIFDTHIILWCINDDVKLPRAAAELIDNPDNELYFSSAVIWEISIKAAAKRPDFPFDPAIIRHALLQNGWNELPINGDHSVAVGSLPPIHGDPFDRIQVAQATVEGILLVTSDGKLAQYPGPIKVV